MCLQAFLAAIYHWFFAINYFEGAISTSVLIKWESTDFEEREYKLKRNKWIIRALNIAFVVTNLVSPCLIFALDDSDDPYYTNAL